MPAPGTLYRAVDVGRWIARQHERWSEPAPAQRAELPRLGVPAPAAPSRPARAGVGRSRDETFALNLSAAAAFRAREGDLEVPRGHVETVTAPDGTAEAVKLGVWITNVRTRRAKLASERVDTLDALGMRWA
ncbi:helicase associated domain-containing protein [Embleya sp. NPDC005575]|uniref:helicase associated domain-containing protein n=1 Tax=Embleya sp. NPDC005575 TaxID=3156892 RepID=UPI0033B2A823